MTIYDKIRNEKLQYGINRATAKILSSAKIEKYEYLKSKEMLPTQQHKHSEDTEFLLFSTWEGVGKPNKDY